MLRVKDLENQVYTLNERYWALDQYTRRENIEILNIPDRIKQNELEAYVIVILKGIGLVNICSYDIAACHRLRKNSSHKYSPTIVRFVNRKDAIDAMLMRFNTTLRAMPFPEETLIITENLVSPRKRIFRKLRDIKRCGIISSLWTKNGTIYIRKFDENKLIKITSERQLQQHFSDT